MQTTLEQPQVTATPTTQATLPTITYDRTSRTINATVIASSTSEPLIPCIGFSGPSGHLWTVSWNVVVVSDGWEVKDFSVEPGSTPGGITVGRPEQIIAGDPSGVKVMIMNSVEDINSFGYDVTLTLSRTDGSHPEARFSTKDKTITIDLSIAVVLDPAG